MTMTAIVSLSLGEELLAEMDRLQGELGFSGRSELVRSGIKMLLNDRKEKGELKGEIEAILLVVHGEQKESGITEMKHKFDDVIKTDIHSNLKNGKCLEVFILNGDAEKIRKFYMFAQTNKKIDYTKLVAA